MNKYRIISSGVQILSGFSGLAGLILGNPELALMSAGVLGSSTYISYVQDEKMEQDMKDFGNRSRRAEMILSRFDRLS